MKDKHWAAFIIAAWLFVLAASSFYRQPEEWLEVGSVTVSDAYEGDTPAVNYQRTIKKPFRGSWLVEVSDLTDAGMVAMCRAEGSNYYEPGNALPANVTLKWLMGDKACPLRPGNYVVDVVWTVRPTNAPAMEIVRTSNKFRVIARGK